MKLVLVRHAEAVDKGVDGAERDFDRHLTDRGRDQAERLARLFSENGVAPDAVVTSPLVRAKQTADPLTALLPGGAREPVVCEYLAPDEYRPKKLSKFVESLGAETVVVVGHMPSLGAYAGWLIGADDDAVHFDKGAAAVVDCPNGPEAGGGVLTVSVW